MAKETETEKNIPEQYRWDELIKRDGIELKKFYNTLLTELGKLEQGVLRRYMRVSVLI